MFSLTDTKSKGVVQYPEAFSGSFGENVFKFIKEFSDALAADQVRKVDEVKRFAQELIGRLIELASI